MGSCSVYNSFAKTAIAAEERGLEEKETEVRRLYTSSKDINRLWARVFAVGRFLDRRPPLMFAIVLVHHTLSMFGTINGSGGGAAQR